MKTRLIIDRDLIGMVLLVSCMALTVQAQDARVQINYLNRLAKNAVEAVDVALDEQLLEVLAISLSSNNQDQAGFKGAVADLKSVYVKGFKFRNPGEYTTADVDELRIQLRPPGWERVASIHNKRGGDNGELYLRVQGGEVIGMVIISAEPTELYVINITGLVRLERLSFREGLRGLSQLNQDWSRWVNNRQKSGRR